MRRCEGASYGEARRREATLGRHLLNVDVYTPDAPLNEPLRAAPLLVIDTEREILEAPRDYELGKMGAFV